MTSQLAGAPGYLPIGFRFSHVTPGSATALIGRDPDQRTYTFVRVLGLRTDELTLRVVIAPAGGGELKATESHAPTMLSSPTLAEYKVAYHDGYWTEGPGTDQVEVAPARFIHWERGRLHSILVSGVSATYAVLAPADLPVGELVKVASSIPGVA